MKLQENKEQVQKMNTINYVARLLAYVYGQKQKENFTSDMKITSIIIFWLTFQNPNTPNLSLTRLARAL